MTTPAYDYGSGGLFGVGTPQANPTVEAELRILLPSAAALVTARMVSGSADPLQRLSDYLDRLPETLEQFDALRPAAFGFACTGSSYLAAPGREAALVGAAQQRLGYPVITAAAAINAALRRLAARRIALIAPYPAALADRAGAYWQAAGYELADVHRVETGSVDTRAIYRLGSAAARAAAEAACASGVDAVVLTGTGMPTLPLLAAPPPGAPLLSSNQSLAAALCRAAALAEPEPAAWRARLAAALAPSD